ncbi:MAG: hypothetical protein GY862_08830 [Gammaproteobacteria bacterium]|nr:hypothetical protein [Gammaproteobacteria bacterium]
MRKIIGTNIGRTPLELAWPATSEFTSVAEEYQSDAVKRMMETVWNAYDLLVSEFLSQIDINQADEQLELSITQVLEPCIRRCLSCDAPYFVQHGPYEYETREPAPAQPPQYDIAFILTRNRRIMWPLEAKVMRTPRNVSPYIKEIQENYITSRYAPFSSSAAMVGYLLSGQASIAAGNIAAKLGSSLDSYPHLASTAGSHYISRHHRSFQNQAWASGDFDCHHLLMLMKVSH